MNKQLADFKLDTSKKHSKGPLVQRHNADFDDSRSEASYISSGSSMIAPSGYQSNFSSALKKPPVFMNANQSSQNIHDMSSSYSQISYEEGFPNAEHNAIEHEMISKQRKEQQERKLQEFQERTKQNAQKKLKEEKLAKERAEQEKEFKDRERQLKAKDYAKKQRTLNESKKNKKVEVLSESQISGDDPAGKHTNYHSQFKHNQDLAGEVIQEVSEQDERERTLIEQSQIQVQQEENVLEEMFKRIDQEELEKLGVGSKQDISVEAITELHEYSMLQRFRQNRDLKQEDTYKPKGGKKGQDKENRFSQQSAETVAAQKSKVEKNRYIKALKALVYEKGGKFDGSEIPSLCSCGALNENLKSMQKGGKNQKVTHMCASNCQFYKNEKDYERALRDILHCISQFK